MDDARIVELFWARDEAALTEAKAKYESYCFSIANGILRDTQDAQECVNDTFLGAWNAIPPHRPEMLSTFLGKITRRLSLNKWREKTAGKRGGGNVNASLEELNALAIDGRAIDESLAEEELSRILRSFLETLPADERRVFLCRYWYFDSIGDICKRFGFSKSKVKSQLKRTRDKLAQRLREEGVWV